MRSAQRRIVTISTAALAAVLLASCGTSGNGASEETTTPESSETAETPDAEPTETESEPEPEEETSSSTALSTNYAAEAVDFGEPGATTDPGTQLAFGQPAWVNQTENFGEEETTGGVGVSILAIQELDASMFDDYENAEEFAGLQPYAIIYQVQWLYDAPEGYKPTSPALFPIHEDGSDAQYLVSGMFTTMFSSPGDSCGLQLPPYDEATRTLVTCMVGLGSGQPLVGAMFNGESYGAFFATDGNPYVGSPIVWR
ncbi:hypothetical protein EDD28_0381 [Salana multivorans]|uniref:Lipoprotein n=1 Tax=Salana multivorans TaxID=120377 RepID=A0A3N2D7Q7_9MICO|nr:hypothetical protein EDD28_0381 [Salana multivorans]